MSKLLEDSIELKFKALATVREDPTRVFFLGRDVPGLFLREIFLKLGFEWNYFMEPLVS